MLRSYTSYLDNANTGKKEILKEFLSEYRIFIQLAIDFFWDTEFTIKDEIYSFKQDNIVIPKYLDYNLVPYNGRLSARARSSAIDQVLDVLKSQLVKRSRLQFVIQKKRTNNENTEYLEKCLEQYPFVKPVISDSFPARLSSKCIDVETDSKHFDQFIRIKSTGFPHICLPIKTYKKLKHNAKQLGEIRLFNDKIILSYEIPNPSKRTEGKKIGADPGVNTVLSLSDNQQTPTDPHGHNLQTITNKLARKKKGSKSFQRAQEHRKNYVNWSINQLNFDGIREIRLEKINLFTGKRSRKLSHFAHDLIATKIFNLAEELGVQVILQSCIYRSQRCSGCGMVCKKHRKGKVYTCSNCGLNIDSDVNAALNHEADLPDIPMSFTALKLNKTGFFWKETGLFDLSGQELGVPDANKRI